MSSATPFPSTLRTINISGNEAKVVDLYVMYFVLGLIFFVFYGPFKNISLISSRSFIKVGIEH